jgi:hypothetical protein
VASEVEPPVEAVEADMQQRLAVMHAACRFQFYY